MKVNKTIARIVFLLYLAVLMYLCFGKFQGIPQAPHGFFGIEGDKVVHFLMFLPFPILSYFAFPFPRTGHGTAFSSYCASLPSDRPSPPERSSYRISYPTAKPTPRISLPTSWPCAFRPQQSLH